LYDRSKPQPLYSFGSPRGDVSNKIDEEEEEKDADESDAEDGVVDGHTELHNSSSQTNLIRQKLSADDNGNDFVLPGIYCFCLSKVVGCMAQW